MIGLPPPQTRVKGVDRHNNYDACTVVCVACVYGERGDSARVTVILVWGTTGELWL